MPPWVTSGAVSRDRDRTATGLLLLVIGFAMSWVPYLSFVGDILAFVGIIVVIVGRRGFGPEHQRNVVIGGVLFIVTLVGAVGLAVWFVFALLGQASASGTGVTIAASQLQGDFEALFIGAALLGILGSLSRVIMVYGLADRTTRTLLWAGFVASVAVSLLVLAVLYPQIVTAINQATSGSTIDTGPLTSLQGEETLLGLLNVLPAALFAWAYWRAREESMNRPSGPSSSF